MKTLFILYKELCMTYSSELAKVTLGVLQFGFGTDVLLGIESGPIHAPILHKKVALSYTNQPTFLHFWPKLPKPFMAQIWGHFEKWPIRVPNLIYQEADFTSHDCGTSCFVLFWLLSPPSPHLASLCIWVWKEIFLSAIVFQDGASKSSYSRCNILKVQLILCK